MTSHDFAALEDGYELAARYMGTAGDKSLLVKLGLDGAFHGGLGRRSGEPNARGHDNDAFLDASSDAVYVAFERRPILNYYDRSSGRLVRSVTVRHPIFGDLEKRTKPFENPRPNTYFSPRYTAGVKRVGKRVYVLLGLPHVEIIGFDNDGHEVVRCRTAALPFDISVFGGWDIREQQGRLEFAISAMKDAESTPVLLLLDTPPTADAKEERS